MGSGGAGSWSLLVGASGCWYFTAVLWLTPVALATALMVMVVRLSSRILSMVACDKRGRPPLALALGRVRVSVLEDGWVANAEPLRHHPVGQSFEGQGSYLVDDVVLEGPGCLFGRGEWSVVGFPALQPAHCPREQYPAYAEADG